MLSLGLIKKEYSKKQPLKGITVGMALHVTKETNDINNLMILCQSCHTALHNKTTQDYNGRGYKIWTSRRKGILI